MAPIIDADGTGRGHHKWHWIHKAAEWKAKIASGIAGVFLILAWVATFRGTVFGLIAPHWYWSALVLSVLAICAKIVWATHDKKCEE